MHRRGYIDDAVYPDFFHREMTPLWLSTAATALGRHAPDPTGACTWMELGCGAGLGALLTAAANPAGRFIGIDIDAAHIASATARARAAAVGNVEFRQDDLVRLAADMAADMAADLPACDYIVLHGVYSWVAPDVQAAIRRIVQRWLKPGGLLYLGYMSHPGPSAFMAAQRFMRLHAQRAQGTSDVRARDALAMLQRLAQGGAGYFEAQPGVADQIARVAGESSGYLAHEFLNAHWQPLHVADVMAQCGDAGCSYIGSATLIENIDAVSIPAQTQPLLRGIDDPALAETVRDLARNQSQRRDIYQRCDGRPERFELPVDMHRERLMAQVVAPLPGLPARGPFVLETRIGPVEMSAPLFTPLLEALANGAQSLGTLALLPDFAPQPGVLNQASQTLFGAALAHPAQLADSIDAAAAWRVNLESSASGADPCWLVAPALGSALRVTPIQRLAAQALLRAPRLRGAALQQQVAQLDGASVATPTDAPALRRELAEFESAVLPLWLRYGIVRG